MSVWKLRIKPLGAYALLIAGSFILLTGIIGLTRAPNASVEYTKINELLPGQPGFPDFIGQFPIEKVDRVSVAAPRGHAQVVDIAHYHNAVGQNRHAVIYLSTGQTQPLMVAPIPDMNQLRWQSWLDVYESFRNSTPENSLFIAWWDNSQRIHLLSGEKTWVNAPVSDALDQRQQQLWKHVRGGVLEKSERLTQLANWLLMDAEDALTAIDKRVGLTHELYFLVSVDDLARLSEMAALSGKSIPFKTRLFRTDENVHRLISRVKRWARGEGRGSYMVQYLDGRAIRVWCITSTAGEQSFLARLLPFTSSLANPLPGMDLIHRSRWSGYLSLYQRTQ